MFTTVVRGPVLLLFCSLKYSESSFCWQKSFVKLRPYTTFSGTKGRICNWPLFRLVFAKVNLFPVQGDGTRRKAFIRIYCHFCSTYWTI